MPRAEREKGKRGELEVAKILSVIWPEVRTKRAGGESAPQDRGRDLLGTPGWCWQVKRRERLNIYQAMEECQQAMKGTEVPAVAHRKNGSQWLATLPLEELVGLLEDRVAKAERPGFGDCGEYL